MDLIPTSPPRNKSWRCDPNRGLSSPGSKLNKCSLSFSVDINGLPITNTEVHHQPLCFDFCFLCANYQNRKVRAFAMRFLQSFASALLLAAAGTAQAAASWGFDDASVSITAKKASDGSTKEKYAIDAFPLLRCIQLFANNGLLSTG